MMKQKKNIIYIYQYDLGESMKGSEFVFNNFHSLYYKCHEININRGRSYIDSHDWIKNKQRTVNLINKKDSKCFQYTITVALNCKEVKKDPQGTKLKPFMSKYNSKRIIFLSKKSWLEKVWEKY